MQEKAVRKASVKTSTEVEQSQPRKRYEPPELRRLGTLAELTAGGTIGPDDGFGGAGNGGSI